MTIHTGAKPADAQQTDTSRPDWSSLDAASREKAVSGLFDRIITALIADIRETAGTGPHTHRIMLTVAAGLVRMIGQTAPPDGIHPEIWREATFDAVRAFYFAGAPPLAINRTPLTEALAPGFLETATDSLATTARTLKARAKADGLSHEAFLATAAAAHCIQMAGLVLERAGTGGWSSDTALTRLHGAFRVTETLVRDAMARGVSFPEVMGHA